MKFQTVLYKSHKGTKAWELPQDIITQLVKAFKGLKTEDSFISVPASEIRQSIKYKLHCTNDSLASQIGRKHKDHLRAIANGDLLLFRPPTATEEEPPQEPEKEEQPEQGS